MSPSISPSPEPPVFNPLVSLFSNAFENLPTDIPAAQFIASIRSDRHKVIVTEIRKRFQIAIGRGVPYDKAKRVIDSQKKKLTSVSFAGVLPMRDKNLMPQFTGLYQADLDLLSDRLVYVRAILCADPHVYAVFDSSSGEGLKAIYRVPICQTGDQYKQVYTAVAARVLELTGVVIDKLEDFTRLCFASYDPHAHLNPDAVELPVDFSQPAEQPVPNEAKAKAAPADSESRRTIAKQLLGEIDWDTDVLGHCTCPGATQHTTGESARECRRYINQVPTIYCMHKSCEAEVADANRRLRSEIGKAERPAPAAGQTRTSDSTGSPAPDDATRIFILPNDHSSISDSARDIFTAIATTHTLFVRAGSIVEIVRKSNGSSLELLRPESFRSRLERYGYKLVAWKTEDGGGKVLKPKNCSEDNAKALLATVEARELLPSIRTVAAAPVIVPDGDGVKVLGPGYHTENGGTLVVGGEIPPAKSADEATALLLATLDEFVFQCPGDRARAFAAMLTPALKMGGFIRGFIPVDVREADQSQTGKGFSLSIVRSIYRETAYPIALKSGGVGSLDESICSALISGKPFIAIDNVRGKLDSQFLEMILTWGDAVAARIPHKGEVLVDPGAASFQLTSNGIEATPDFANRACITRMLKQRPGFAFKKYAEGNLRDHIVANQPRYLGAVFALIRDWCRRGRPSTDVTGHDFREWAGILDSFTTYYLGENLLAGHQQAQARTANPALSWLRAVGLLVLQSGKAGQNLRAAELYELSADDQLAIPGMRTPDDQQGPQIVGRALSKCFCSADRVEVDHLVVERIVQTEYDPRDRKDVTRKLYRFTTATGGACGACGPNPGDSGKHPLFPESNTFAPHDPQTAAQETQQPEALLL